ncbi:MAG: ABC transporter substrate-binding protein [Candidatus Omnitrophica bacterium]|nr:ABC transporter substrate-binding protein [Candidatus Omnitrophota bacterium]
MKRMPVTGAAVLLSMAVLAGTSVAANPVKIGILRTGDQAHYLAAQDAIMAELNKEGFDASKVVVDIQSAGDKKENVAAIAKGFKDKAYDLVIPIGTAAATGAAKEITDIPIVFSSVYDPVVAGIVKSWESSGNNVTGGSTWVNMKQVVKVLREVGPVQKIGVIYSATDKRTAFQLQDIEKASGPMNFTVVPADLAKPEDAAFVAQSLVGKVDFIFLTALVLNDQALKDILAVAAKEKIPTASLLMERVDKGVLIVVASDSKLVGALTGKKAVQVLKGVKPANIPIEFLDRYDVAVNIKAAQEIGIVLPEGLLKKAVKVIK